jgi:uncharacterized protein YcfJ
MLRKYFTAILMATVFGVMLPFAGAADVSAQTRYYYNARNNTVTKLKRPNVYRRHRKAFNIGIGTAAGALIGGLLGGRKGAVIGALGGAGGGALFTHYQRPKNYTRAYTYRARPVTAYRSYRNY